MTPGLHNLTAPRRTQQHPGNRGLPRRPFGPNATKRRAAPAQHLVTMTNPCFFSVKIPPPEAS